MTVVESMNFDLPIVAYDCKDVRDTPGGAGLLLKNKRVDYLGEMLKIVAHDRKLREKIIEGQRRRLKEFQGMELEKFLIQNLNDLIE